MQIPIWSFFVLLIGLFSKETPQVSAKRIWSSSAILSTSKPGCPVRCGNLTIPYPFGIGKGCYFNKYFEVSCINNTASSDNIELRNISMDSITVVVPFSPKPYNKSSGKNINGDARSISTEYFSFSKKNILVAIGCDVYAGVKDLDASSGGNTVGGCASFCSNLTNNFSSSSASSSYCTGSNGCCQSAFSKIPGRLNVSIQTMNTEKTTWASTNCTYLIIVEKGFSESNFPQLLGKCKEDDYYVGRVAVDWVIGNVSCDKAIRRPKYYACRNNSRCVDDTTRPAGGYRCTCSSGYQGNPYLPHGCHDIDECANPKGKRCPNNTRCVNTPGSFLCEQNNVKTHSMLAMQLSLGIVAAITFIVLVAFYLWLRKWLRKREEKKVKQKFFKRNGGLLLQQRISVNGESSGGSLSKLFSKEELEKSTDNFNEIRILGKGGLGTVYKGMLSDGSIVAVKKSNAVDEDQIEQFINEILILSQINHRHIVKVLGCCLETQVPLLVYEYISNGTLSSHIHGNLSHYNPTIPKPELDVQTLSHPATILSWDHRLQIAKEIAGALSYMHSCASIPILHRDIKSSNILLDDNFRAVVSDFGISRFLSVDKTHLTTLVGGTFGYIDPEYFRSGQLTDKCDVYAFGVILAELLTSQRVVTSNKPEDPSLVIRFTMSLKQNSIFEIVDPEIVKEVEDEHVILSVAKLAKRCLKFNARKRPCMKEVAAELDRLGKMQQDMSHAECLQDNSSPKSESSHSYTSDCTEADNQNSASHNEMHYD
ncbi:wall-associated receptor kinase-like 8 [Lycium barbarum]|uniref:wall-associated receptor kinase-like 8 n=1 Tax=Lycium barbarum TaxID=112863 RepID=UPI00293E99CD|nr:wall-associated receptor kinase-like 8 [Lycium barbarum]